MSTGGRAAVCESGEMMHHDVRAPTFDRFFRAEFPRLVSMRTAWSGTRAFVEELAPDAPSRRTGTERPWSPSNGRARGCGGWR